MPIRKAFDELPICGGRREKMRRSVFGKQLKPFAVHIEQLHGRIILQVFPELGNVNIHASAIEIIIILPDRLQCEIAVEQIIHIEAKQLEQLGFLGGQLLCGVAETKSLVLKIEFVFPDGEFSLT